jgi:A/G-specific adenine glycosylase
MLNTTNLFSELLLNWWSKNKRSFPWRETNDAYSILVAEVLLHRTKASQVEPVFVEFLASFPTPSSLSTTSLEEIQKILYPLGLCWRTKLMHEMANEILQKFGGEIPAKKEFLMTLPGVSDYIASAVMCFAYHCNEPLLDTNTVRVIGRVLDIKITDGSRRSIQFKRAYLKLQGTKKVVAREFAFAMLDFAALVCLPKKPLCEQCKVRDVCKYRAHTKQKIEAII